MIDHHSRELLSHHTLGEKLQLKMILTFQGHVLIRSLFNQMLAPKCGKIDSENTTSYAMIQLETLFTNILLIRELFCTKSKKPTMSGW